MVQYHNGNPYMKATSLDELKQMEKQLYEETWVDGKIDPGSEEYYQKQIELFEEAFASLFPEDYDFHKKSRS